MTNDFYDPVIDFKKYVKNNAVSVDNNNLDTPPAKKRQKKRRKRARDYIREIVEDESFEVLSDQNYIPFDRKFYLHVGPTNSGKTYDAIEALKHAGSGCYLGPLRLLAAEIFDVMNDSGVPCSMLTGEEEQIIDGANFISSTVEMLNENNTYDVCVIDECQMISDPSRGYAWYNAIRNVRAKEIHLCLAPEALNIIEDLIYDLEEDYEVIEHKRLSGLEYIPPVPLNKVERGDALIVFSRRKVLQLSEYFEHNGVKTSVIYGSLPYKVRKEEARKFSDGESDIVIATDAIGMGLNLPIRRVLFLETSKFDGNGVRQLTQSEALQIAGRAGRFGKYDTGYFGIANSFIGKPRVAVVKNILKYKTKDIDKIIINIPKEYLFVDDKISIANTMRYWNNRVKVDEPFEKRDLKDEIELAMLIQDVPNEVAFKAVNIAFKNNEYLPTLKIWRECVKNTNKYYKNGRFDLTFIFKQLEHTYNLRTAENNLAILDLAHGLCKFAGGDNDAYAAIEDKKDEIIEKLKGYLADKNSKYINDYYNDYFDMDFVNLA